MERAGKIDGESAYEQMRQAVGRASRTLTSSQFPSHDRP